MSFLHLYLFPCISLPHRQCASCIIVPHFDNFCGCSSDTVVEQDLGGTSVTEVFKLYGEGFFREKEVSYEVLLLIHFLQFFFGWTLEVHIFVALRKFIIISLTCRLRHYGSCL